MLLLHDAFYFVVWIVLFGTGPLVSMYGLVQKRLAISVVGCLLCWLPVGLAFWTVVGIPFNILSLLPVIVYAVLATHAMLWVLIRGTQ